MVLTGGIAASVGIVAESAQVAVACDAPRHPLADSGTPTRTAALAGRKPDGAFKLLDVETLVGGRQTSGAVNRWRLQPSAHLLHAPLDSDDMRFRSPWQRLGTRDRLPLRSL